MATTTNFGWETPDDTDLVKDSAAAIRTVANSIDTSFVDLKGGTTNQVLAKNSNTDLDFKWVADATGIPATIIDAKGDLIAGTAADTAGRLAVGANGTVLTADSGETTGIKWATPATGGMTLITSASLATNSSVSLTVTGTYNNLLLIAENVYASTGTSLRIRLNGDTGNNYAFSLIEQASASYSLQGTSGISSIPIAVTVGTASSAAISAAVTIYNYSAAYQPAIHYCSSGLGSNYYSADGNGTRNNASATTSVQLLVLSGTFSAGTVYLYGVK